MMKHIKDILKEGILDDQDEVMDQMDKGAVVIEYNAWLRRNATARNLKITTNDVQIVDGEVIVTHPSTMFDIRELPPYKVVLKSTDKLHASVGTSRHSDKAGVTLRQQMEALKQVIEDSNGFEIDEFRLDNRVCGESRLDGSVLSCIAPIEIKHAVMYMGENTLTLPYIYRCKNLEIQVEGHGDVYMNGIPAGVSRLTISRK